MPRRFLMVREMPYQSSCNRLRDALHKAVDGPSVDEIIETQDNKLREIKRSVFSDHGGPVRLYAAPPVLVSSIIDMPLDCFTTISTHYNDNQLSLFSSDKVKVVSEVEIDFSRAEDFLQLETPIDARKDHNMLKIAYTIPKRTFMQQILRKFPINKKRLAFIQRRPPPTKTSDVGNLIIGEGKEVSITCQVCGQRFNRQHHFQRHILTHPDPENKKFLCQICGKRFNRADHLNRHVLLHGDIKLQKCVLCGEEFDRASHLDRHRRKHHPPAGQQPSQTPPLTPQVKSPPANMIMGTPTAGFDGVGFLASDVNHITPGTGNNLHLLAAVATPDGSAKQPINPDPSLAISLHQPLSNIDFGPPAVEVEPDRPFPCEVCGRKFIRATHLRRHMRIHTGEKPFACHICGRRYARGDYLRAHIFAHRRDKLHKCKHCGEVFQDLTRFADHCRLMHKDTNDEHGNPKPPPDNSPPPVIPTVLDSTLAAESVENITVVQSVPVWGRETQGDIPISLVNLSDQDQHEAIISNYHNHQLPAPTHVPELHLTHLPADTHVLMNNGQLGLPDSTNEVTILGQPPALSMKPQSSEYLDPVAQYILNSGNIGTSMSAFPNPHHTHVIGQGYPQSAT